MITAVRRSPEGEGVHTRLVLLKFGPSFNMPTRLLLARVDFELGPGCGRLLVDIRACTARLDLAAAVEQGEAKQVPMYVLLSVHRST